MTAFGVGIFLGILFVTPLVLVYFAFIRWCDRFEPEPLWLLGLAFAWGAVFATFLGGMSTGFGETLVSSAMGVKPSHPAIQQMGAVVFAPVFEEGFKAVGLLGIALLSALGLKELDGALDGAIYGGIIGLGFTLTEDILYVARQFASGGFREFFDLFFVRTVLLGLSHCTFTACTGLAIGIAAERGLASKLILPPIGFFCAILMHSVHNALPAFFGEPGVAVMIITSWVIDLAFFAILAALVTRDRAVVVRELSSELGRLISPKELKLVASYLRLGSRNWAILRSQGWKAFRVQREKQLALVELAFVKTRRRRGQSGSGLDARESRLRATITRLTAEGVRLE